MLLVAACSSSTDTEQGDGDEVDASAESTETTVDRAEVDDEPDSDSTSTDTTTPLEEETDAMGEDGGEDEQAPSSTIAGDEAVPGTTLPALGSTELAAALAASTGDAFSLPFMYLTVEQDCADCADTMSLYYVPSEAKPSILTLAGAFVDGVQQPDFSAVAESLRNGDPRWIAEQLEGADATFGVDPRSGAITTWTLPGESVTIRCLQVDTRPIDMRTELCENSVVG